MRGKCDYYPEAYGIFVLGLMLYLITDIKELTVIGCIPGAAMMPYYYVQWIKNVLP